MNKKKLFKIIKENTIIIIWAAFVALGLFFISQNPNFFTTSVLSLQEKTFIVEKWRDIAYKTNSGYIDIFMSDKMETPTNIDFTISFDIDTVTIDTQNLSGQRASTITNQDENNISIQTTANQNTDKSQSILMLPFTWDNTAILLSEAVAKLSNNQKKDLSIGSLNEITSHSK